MRLDARACLGLVLAISALHELAKPLFPVVRLVLDEPSSIEPSLLLPVAVIACKFFSGCALAFGARTLGWIALAGYGASSLGLALVFVWSDPPVGELGMVAMLIELFGVPVIVLVAMLRAGAPGATTRGEVGVLLVILGIASLIGAAYHLVDDLRQVELTLQNFESKLNGSLTFVGLLATVAIFQLRAGLQLRRRTATADRALRTYAMVAIGADLLSIVVGLMFGASDGRAVQFFVSAGLVGSIDDIAVPLLAMALVKRDRATPTVHPAAHLPMSPTWNALLLVPFLATRPLLADDLIPEGAPIPVLAIAMVAAALAIAVSLSVAATLGGRVSAAGTATLATVLGLLTTVAIVVLTCLEPEYRRIHTGPLTGLVVTTAVMAWLSHTTAPPVPRAIVRR